MSTTHMISGLTGFMHNVVLPELGAHKLTVTKIEDYSDDDVTEVMVNCTGEELKEFLKELDDPDEELGGYWEVEV